MKTRGKNTEINQSSADSRDVDFRSLWRSLQEDGWMVKKPSGLSVEWRYFRNKVKQGKAKEGIDFFRGQNAVIQYCIENEILHRNPSKSRQTMNIDNKEQPLCEPPIAVLDNNGNHSTSTGYFSSLLNSTKSVKSYVSESDDDTVGSELHNSTSQDIYGHFSAVKSTNYSCGLATLAGYTSDSSVSTTLSLAQSTTDLPSVITVDTTHVLLDNSSQYSASSLPLNFDGSTTPVLFQNVQDIDDINYISIDNQTNEVFLESEDEDEEIIDDLSDEGGVFDSVRQDYSEDESEIDEQSAAVLDDSFLESLGGRARLRDGNFDKQVLRNMRCNAVSTAFEENSNEYAGVSFENAKPKDEVRAKADDPLQIFLHFFPLSLWQKIAFETNRYREQQIVSRMKRLRRCQKERHRIDPNFRVEGEVAIMARLRDENPVLPHELMHVIGLLIARSLCPHRRQMSMHWAMKVDGAIPSGTFGKYIARDRFNSIIRDLHFANNEAPRSRIDKIWKIRPVVDALTKTFQDSWNLPSVFSFDEGVLPATSKRNTTRMFMPDKPHRYGTKMFLTCDPRTAYCHRFEIYVGKKSLGETQAEAFDHQTGPAAVVRNMQQVLKFENDNFWRIVVLDRFYTSVALCIQLLAMKIYAIGTVMTNRLGYDNCVVDRRTKRPKTVPHGSFKFSRSTNIHEMMSLMWWDKKPVHFLSTGATANPAQVNRRSKYTPIHSVSCPKVVQDYQKWMGGADVHDQLRLQRYSIQKSLRFSKYYKSLFMGLIDMCIVNAYISHHEHRQLCNQLPMKRGEFMACLHNQLLQVASDAFETETMLTPVAVRSLKRRRSHDNHQASVHDDWIIVGGVQKRRQRACKVCSILRGNKKKSFQTSTYCENCSADQAKLYLCPTTRRKWQGISKTCFQIWHEDWDSGNSLPNNGKRVVLRRPPNSPGAHRNLREDE